MSQAIVTAIQLVSFVVIIIIMAVMANTMAMTARERIGEYAIFKTLGFGGSYIAALIFGESLIISMIGCGFGVALTFPAAQAFGEELSTFFPIFNVAIETIYMDISAALVVGTVAGFFPAWHSTRIRIAAGLRRIG
jgi:putative ABC transport system permease protein